MQDSQQLRPFMGARFTAAKSAQRWAGRVGVAIGLVAVVVVLVPESVAWVAWGGGILSVVLVVAQQYLLYRFRKAYSEAEEIRRLCMVSSGLGSRIPAVEMASLRRRFGCLEDKHEDPYYTSHLEPGPKRLLMLTWESAFWSEDLQEHLASKLWRRAAVTTLLFSVAVVVALVGPEGPVVPKVVVASLSFLVGLNFWGKWWDAKQTERACRETAASCRSRVQDGVTCTSELDELREVMQVVLGYCATLQTAEPPPDKLYEQRKPILDAEWAKVAEEVPGGG